MTAERLWAPDQRCVYRIQVRGTLSEDWLPWVEGLAPTFDGDVATLTGAFADQAALRGVLCWLWDLGLTLVSVNRLGNEPGQKGTLYD